MNKKTILKSYDNKVFIRDIINYKDNEQIKKELIKEMEINNIPLNALKENDISFNIGQLVIFKQNMPQTKKGILKVFSNFLEFEGLRIDIKDIKDINSNGFKTDYAIYILS